MLRPTIVTLLWLAVLAGCADPIGHAPADAGLIDIPGTGKVRTARAGDGTYTTLVDATSATDWVYADFKAGTVVTVDDAWDLRFQRFHISTNGGVSGTRGVAVAPITDAAFADVTLAPPTGYLSDTEDADGDGMPDYAFDQGDAWYDYDDMTHALTAKPLVWVMKNADGAAIKLQILKYYDAAGTAGWFTLHWAAL